MLLDSLRKSIKTSTKFPKSESVFLEAKLKIIVIDTSALILSVCATNCFIQLGVVGRNLQ